jgi:hypothetical protein
MKSPNVLLGLVMFTGACSSSNGAAGFDASSTRDANGTHDANGTDDAKGHSGDAGSGSSVDNLTFAVVGDTRPASIDDTSNYPTTIITKIYQDVEASSPKPSFVIGTGDYQYASTTGSDQQPQIDKYMSARAAFSGPLYPAMGNHECTGYTDSNCGSGNTDGVTKNLTVFINTMLSPIGETAPYYSEKVSATDGSWTAKFVFIACNAWTSAQSSWLTTQLADTTTYTFVVRHESVADMSGTKCAASQTIVNAHPLTLLIVGHTHEYAHYSSDKEIINGIGGAPLTSGTNYGYTIVNRNSDGTLTVTTYDYSSQSQIDSFKIKASGSAG